LNRPFEPLPDHQVLDAGSTPALLKVVKMLPPSRPEYMVARTAPLKDSIGRLLGTPYNVVKSEIWSDADVDRNARTCTSPVGRLREALHKPSTPDRPPRAVPLRVEDSL
jgi:hypothetical protein